jgi:hypothetical protein
MLAKDELLGLVVAGAVAAAALGTFIYRSTWAPVTPRSGAVPVAAAPAAPEPRGSQDLRDAFADGLHQAFAQDGVDAAAVRAPSSSCGGSSAASRWCASCSTRRTTR